LVSDDGHAWEIAGTTSAPTPASTAGYPPDFLPSESFLHTIRSTQVDQPQPLLSDRLFDEIRR